MPFSFTQRQPPLAEVEGPEPRIVIVGDSRVFGWKLSDAERLQVALQDTLERIAPNQRFEVVTVALPGWNVDAEFNDREHHEGVLSMARSQDPNSAGSQFFICLGRDHCQHLDGQYTAFGKVTDGIEVVREIGTTQIGQGDRPVESISMTTVTA